MALLSMRDSYTLLKKYNIPHAAPHYVKSAADLEKFTAFPCVIKADAENLVHKSEAGAVIAGIKNKEELVLAYNKIIDNTQKYKPLRDIAIFRMEKGTELFMGMKRDATFGTVITFGLGGIFVEILKDVSLKIAPFPKSEAFEMIKEIKSYKILEGARGKEPVNIDAVEDIIMSLQKLARENKDIQELDFNPVFAGPKGSMVVDVRVLK